MRPTRRVSSLGLEDDPCGEMTYGSRRTKLSLDAYYRCAFEGNRDCELRSARHVQRRRRFVPRSFRYAKLA